MTCRQRQPTPISAINGPVYSAALPTQCRQNHCRRPAIGNIYFGLSCYAIVRWSACWYHCNDQIGAELHRLPGVMPRILFCLPTNHVYASTLGRSYAIFPGQQNARDYAAPPVSSHRRALFNPNFFGQAFTYIQRCEEHIRGFRTSLALGITGILSCSFVLFDFRNLTDPFCNSLWFLR